MVDLSSRFALLVDDEFQLLRQLVMLDGAEVLDVGCGAGAMTEQMATHGEAKRVVGIDVDEVQLEKNARRVWPHNLEFRATGVQQLPFADASIDGITMFKSLHHVPSDLLDAAFREMHRVLRPGGWIYVCEPVYAGDYNDVMRLFHDEGRVRELALLAMERAVAAGLLARDRRLNFCTQVSFADFEDFRRRKMSPSHSRVCFDSATLQAVREVFEMHMTPRGAHFSCPMRVDLLVRSR
jgi:SAM-dependent methyltransferase